jgi:hypothetical protein
VSELTFTTMASAAITVLLGILVFSGVVLPAVWSRKRTRRAAAAEVLQQLLDFFRARPGR